MTGRVVWSSGVGRVCPVCGWPADDCHCSSSLESSGSDSVPSRVVAKLRLEKKGRGGKSVTVIDGLPDNSSFLSELATSLKKSCGVGGTVRPGLIELAGDVRDRIRLLLAARGIVVKG